MHRSKVLSSADEYTVMTTGLTFRWMVPRAQRRLARGRGWPPWLEWGTRLGLTPVHIKHSLGQIETDHGVTQLSQQQAEEPSAAANVEDVEAVLGGEQTLQKRLRGSSMKRPQRSAPSLRC